jgi:hypothetical protein
MCFGMKIVVLYTAARAFLCAGARVNSRINDVAKSKKINK